MERKKRTVTKNYKNCLKDVVFEYYKKGYKQRDVVIEMKVSKQLVSKWYIYFKKNNIK